MEWCMACATCARVYINTGILCKANWFDMKYMLTNGKYINGKRKENNFEFIFGVKPLNKWENYLCWNMT